MRLKKKASLDRSSVIAAAPRKRRREVMVLLRVKEIEETKVALLS